MRNIGWNIAFFVYIQLWITTDSNSQGSLCPDRFKDEIVNICSDHSRSRTKDVFIGTASVPKFRQMFCECIITPCHPETEFYSYFLNDDEHDVQIKINNMVLEKTSDVIHTTLSDETTLYFSTSENYTRGACIFLVAWDNVSRFNITCSNPTTIVFGPKPSDTTRATTAEISYGNIATSCTRFSTETIQKSNITSVTTDATYEVNKTIAQYRSKKKTTVYVVPAAVIGVLLIAVVLFSINVIRRRFANNSNRHDQDKCISSFEQGQGQHNNPENEEGNLDIPVNVYERLNMYANDTVAGEMYQQLNVDKTGENLVMYDVGTDSRNRNRNFTKKGKQEGQLKRQARGQVNNSNGEDCDTEISANAYQRLNQYVNDNIAGEMYEQLDANQDVSGRTYK